MKKFLMLLAFAVVGLCQVTPGGCPTGSNCTLNNLTVLSNATVGTTAPAYGGIQAWSRPLNSSISGTQGCVLGMSADGIAVKFAPIPFITAATFGDSTAAVCSLLRWKGLWYAAVQTANTGDTGIFRIISSPSLAPGSWTSVTTITPGVGSGSTNEWECTWFVDSSDPSALPYLYFAAGIDASATMQIYGIQALNVALSAWGTAVNLLPANKIDFSMFGKVGGVYYAVYKNETTGNTEMATCTTALSGCSPVQTGNWTGLGTGEGPFIVTTPTGYNIYALHGVGNTYYQYVSTPSLSAPSVGAVQRVLENPSIITGTNLAAGGAPVLVSDVDGARVALAAMLEADYSGTYHTRAVTTGQSSMDTLDAIVLSGTDFVIRRWSYNGTSEADIGFTPNELYFFGNQSNVALDFGPGNSRAMYMLPATQNVLIGPGNAEGNYKLDITKSGSAGTLRVKDQTATTGATRVLFDLGAADTAATNILTVNGKMTANGGILFPPNCTGLASGAAYNNGVAIVPCP